MADVFISYKKEDFAQAEKVVNALRDSGLSVWWDDGLTAKSAWDAELEREIAAAATVVVLWTPRSINSEWVRTEAHYGQDRGKLIPVMLEPCTIPLAFMLRQTVNLSDWQGEAEHRQWRKLLVWIADLASTKPGNANIPQALGAAQPNMFREAVGHLASGEPIFDGALVNASTPAGTAFRDGEKLPVMRIVPQGAFLLGSPAAEPGRSAVEGPQRRVEIPGPFALGVFPVLVSEYEAIMGALPAAPTAPEKKRGWGRFFGRAAAEAPPRPALESALPVTELSFDDAQSLANTLASLTGEKYRLPSESEWEYACRAGSRGAYAFGDAIGGVQARFAASDGPWAPGGFPANEFGLYDMHGNVREWTADLWHESYDATPLDGSPAVDGHGSMRVVRGGGWSDTAPMLRSAARLRATQSMRSNVIGVRLARDLG